MKQPLQNQLEYIYQLADLGITDLAQAELKIAVEKYLVLSEHPSKVSESIQRSIERTSHRIGVGVAFQYAEYFYKENDKKAARGWLHKAKWDAKQIGLDISDRITEMKNTYKDRMPLFF